MKTLAIVSMLLLSAAGVMAQPNKKVGPALTGFLNTEFMIKYRDLRIQAESAAISIQSQQDQLKPEDRARLRSAYDQTASRANQLLESIKLDLLNAKKLKTIAEFPEMYSDGMRLKLTELSDFYAANFQQTLADVSVDKNKTEVDGSAVLLLVIELIGLSKGLANYFTEIRREARQYTEKHLSENLIQPYRWRYWDELSGSASPYEKFDKSAEADLQDPAAEDPLDRQLQKLNQTIQSLPTKETPVNDEFNLPPDGPAESGNDFQYEDWSPEMTPPTDTTTHNLNSGGLKKAPQPAGNPKKTDKPVKPGGQIKQ